MSLVGEESTYHAFEASRRRRDGKPFRIHYAFANYRDFATVEDALDFVVCWRRPANWQYDEPNVVTRIDAEGGVEEILVSDEVGRAMRTLHQQNLARIVNVLDEIDPSGGVTAYGIVMHTKAFMRSLGWKSEEVSE